MKSIPKRERYYDAFSKLFLFQGVGPETVRFAFEQEDCVCGEFSANEKIYTKTDFKPSIGLVLSGSLKAEKPAGGGPGIVLNLFAPGGVFGAAGLFAEGDGYVSEITAVRRSRILWIPQRLLQSLFQRDPKIAENYIVYLSGRIRFLNSRIDAFTGATAQGRLASFLLELSAGSPENPCRVTLPCGMTRLSEMLAIGRASLYRAVNVLTKEKIIARSGRSVELLDFERLKAGQF